MQRPGMKRLLDDIAAGKVDIILVYKIDRLTRSLADFAKIVEILDKAGASFVFITQSFNTTTSMGRLTLNMLLSFAQFEREVTGEQIRDKIVASQLDFVRSCREAERLRYTYDAVCWNIMRFAVGRGALINAGEPDFGNCSGG